MGKVTGHGATITFSTSGLTYAFENIQLPTFELEDLEITDLETSDFKEYIAGDLDEPGEGSAVFFFDPTISLPGSGVSETITVTFNLPSGGTTAATFAGSGYIKTRDLGNLATGEIHKGTLNWKYDNQGSAPSFTAQT